MSVLDRLRHLKAEEKIPEKILEAHSADHLQEPVPVVIATEVDIATCKKVGVLAAYGLSDRDIADALLLSQEQINYARNSDHFKQAYSRQAQDRAQRAIDLEEGWDAVESTGLATVLETMRTNRDPRFHLQAAFVANRARRRSPASIGRVIDAGKAGNVIMLTMNKNYISTNNKGGEISIRAQTNPAELPRKMSDVLSPKRVGELLQAPKNEFETMKNDLMQQLDNAGVSVDLLEDD